MTALLADQERMTTSTRPRPLEQELGAFPQELGVDDTHGRYAQASHDRDARGDESKARIKTA
jgi:hypothetical protein